MRRKSNSKASPKFVGDDSIASVTRRYYGPDYPGAALPFRVSRARHLRHAHADVGRLRGAAQMIDLGQPPDLLPPTTTSAPTYYSG
mmetsp:Transcript_16140/g.65226  ORF Transcript_16140/g.65226 Transcript_16140/m.65226 type:complete len:86 (-) Transcript_16140:224-481(-)